MLSHANKAVFAAVLLFLPLIVVAQEPRVCTVPVSAIERGDSGDSVANLQLFLARDKSVYPEGIVVGIFGPATERAVGRWQIKYGILPAGSSKSAGLGRVGPRTLAVLTQLWNCSGPISAGWFRAFISGGAVSFSAQASSTYPIDPSLLYVEFGDGTYSSVSVSNAVCVTTGGTCSSLLYANHSYAAGSFSASLKVAVPSDYCAIFSPAWICAQNNSSKTLGAISFTSSGVAANSPSLSLLSLPSSQQSSSSSVSNGATSAAGTSAGLVTSVSAPAPKIPPSIFGSIALSGGTLTLVWTSTSTPAGSSAELVLTNAAGNIIGTIASGKEVKGSYWWIIPRASSTACVADAITCLSQIGTVSCDGGICPLGNGTYGAVVRIHSGANIIAAVSIGTFTLESGALSVLASATSAGGSAASSSSYGLYGAVPATNSVPPQSCTYSGVQYGDGITLGVSCADLAGGSCTSYGGQSLTCKNGSWVNASGTPVAITNVTTSGTAVSGSSCKTPWGNEIVRSGNQITYEPFFTGGNYTGAIVISLMQCTSGQWQKCDWQGASCVAYTVL